MFDVDGGARGDGARGDSGDNPSVGGCHENSDPLDLAITCIGGGTGGDAGGDGDRVLCGGETRNCLDRTACNSNGGTGAVIGELTDCCSACRPLEEGDDGTMHVSGACHTMLGGDVDCRTARIGDVTRKGDTCRLLQVGDAGCAIGIGDTCRTGNVCRIMCAGSTWCPESIGELCRETVGDVICIGAALGACDVDRTTEVGKDHGGPGVSEMEEDARCGTDEDDGCSRVAVCIGEPGINGRVRSLGLFAMCARISGAQSK